MNQHSIKSPAFEHAELESERLRIFGVLAFLCHPHCCDCHPCICDSYCRRPFFRPGVSLLIAIVVVYELLMLWRVVLALKANGSLGHSVLDLQHDCRDLNPGIRNRLP